VSLNDEIEYTFGPRYEHPEIARLRSRITALEGLLRECRPYIVSHDSRAIPSEDAAARALLSRLDAALTPDRKDQDGR